MKPRRPGRLALAASLALAVLAAFAGEARGANVSVSVDREQVTTKLGKKFVFSSTITNHASTASGPLIAHLNVLSYGSGVYVDPEDWSAHRTRYLPSVPPGGSTTLAWRVEGVNAGSFGIYVAVLPQSAVAKPPATGPVVHVTVTQRRTLNSGGILPLALGIPAALGLLVLAARVRRTGMPAIRRQHER